MSPRHNRLGICLALSEFHLAFRCCVYEVNCIFIRIHFEYITVFSLTKRRKRRRRPTFFPVDIVESNLLYHASRMLASASALSELLPRVIPSWRGKKFAYFIFVSAQPWLRSLIHCRTEADVEWGIAHCKWWTGKLICVVNHGVNRYRSSLERAKLFPRAELSEKREWAATSDGGVRQQAADITRREGSVWMWRNHIH